LLRMPRRSERNDKPGIFYFYKLIMSKKIIIKLHIVPVLARTGLVSLERGAAVFSVPRSNQQYS